MAKSIIKIAVVGDVHDLWQPIEDQLALQSLGVDLDSGRVSQISMVWLDSRCKIVNENVLL